MDTTTLVLLIFIGSVVAVGIGGFIWAIKND
jgi:nitrogen fixation-related uncharacterized protein